MYWLLSCTEPREMGSRRVDFYFSDTHAYAETLARSFAPNKMHVGNMIFHVWLQATFSKIMSIPNVVRRFCAIILRCQSTSRSMTE
mmetsp:Transcript_25805/g.53797  ORF Transcript_25805/g.53797 Transcript_25805/m.53797 type:complete len:86 (-) Transcript_25805:1128-1385(-)